MEKKELNKKLEGVKTVEELAKLVTDSYVEATKKFIENLPEEFKISADIYEDDISITNVVFDNDDAFYLTDDGDYDYDEYAPHYLISDYISENLIEPKQFIPGIIKLGIKKEIDDFKENKELTTDDYKKIVINKLIKDNVYLYQEEFKDDLLHELKSKYILPKNLSNNLYHSYSEICSSLASLFHYPNGKIVSETGKILKDFYGGEIQKKFIDPVEKAIDKLNNLSPNEKEKLNNLMSDNDGESKLEDDHFTVDWSCGENVDERIEYLDSLLDQINGLEFEIGHGVYDSYYEYYADDDYDDYVNNSKLIDELESQIFDYCVSKVYPDGIIKGNEYTKDVRDDCEFAVRMTSAYRNMTGNTQEELIQSIENMKPKNDNKEDNNSENGYLNIDVENMTEAEKAKIRASIVEQTKNLKDGEKLELPTPLLEKLIFDIEEDKKGIVKIPVWTGQFLQKISLKDVSFEKACFYAFDDETASDNNEYKIDLSYTDAKIDFSKTRAKGLLNSCNFEGVDLSHSNANVIKEGINCNFANTNIDLGLKERHRDIRLAKCNLSNNPELEATINEHSLKPSPINHGITLYKCNFDNTKIEVLPGNSFKWTGMADYMDRVQRDIEGFNKLIDYENGLIVDKMIHELSKVPINQAEQAASKEVEKMTNNEIDTNGQKIVDNDSIKDDKQMGFAMSWVLGLLTGVISVGILIIGTGFLR